jgi:hypothetical protein
MLVLYNPSIGAPGSDEFLGSLALVNPPPPVQRAGAAGADAGTADGGLVAADSGTSVEPAADAGTTAPDAGTTRRRRAK